MGCDNSYKAGWLQVWDVKQEGPGLNFTSAVNKLLFFHSYLQRGGNTNIQRVVMMTSK